jgi:hypothetical protein
MEQVKGEKQNRTIHKTKSRGKGTASGRSSERRQVPSPSGLG